MVHTPSCDQALQEGPHTNFVTGCEGRQEARKFVVRRGNFALSPLLHRQPGAARAFLQISDGRETHELSAVGAHHVLAPLRSRRHAERQSPSTPRSTDYFLT